jgi:uncharacterized protein
MTETVLSRSATFSARPVLRLGGQADERATQLLTTLRMEESEGGMSTLELRFTNWQASPEGRAEVAFGPHSALRLGAELQVGTGDEATPQEIFLGHISALEMVCDYGRPPELVVLAEDALSAARRNRRSRVFEAMSPAEVVRQVAGDLGLALQVEGLEAPVATWAQWDETDLAFLRRLLQRFDADLQVVSGTLQVGPSGEAARGSIELQLNSQLARVRITADLADQVTAVTVAGWNASQGSAVSARAALMQASGPGAGIDALNALRQATGERTEHLRQPTVASLEEAEAVAQAALDIRARRFVRAHGLAEGNAALRVGATVHIVGVSPQFDNHYRVVQCCHRFDQTQGYRTEFSAECAFLAQ